jgi:hypothetical protein
MSYYFPDQERTHKIEITGRMSVGELISLLRHLDSETQRPWIDSFEYLYMEGSNLTQLTITVMNDRPHKHL